MAGFEPTASWSRTMISSDSVFLEPQRIDEFRFPFVPRLYHITVYRPAVQVGNSTAILNAWTPKVGPHCLCLFFRSSRSFILELHGLSTVLLRPSAGCVGRNRFFLLWQGRAKFLKFLSSCRDTPRTGKARVEDLCARAASMWCHTSGPPSGNRTKDPPVMSRLL